jgi:hypothetical protein
MAAVLPLRRGIEASNENMRVAVYQGCPLAIINCTINTAISRCAICGLKSAYTQDVNIGKGERMQRKNVLEHLRDQLYLLVLLHQNNLLHPEVIRKSQELDLLINERKRDSLPASAGVESDRLFNSESS